MPELRYRSYLVLVRYSNEDVRALTHQRVGVLGNPEVRELDDDLCCAAS